MKLRVYLRGDHSVEVESMAILLEGVPGGDRVKVKFFMN